MKIVLAGTPDFAVPIFEKIINNFNVVAIISQPDRPSVRGHKIVPTPVRVLAQKYNIQLFQPEKIGQIAEELKTLDYDYLVTAAFGQYIPNSILSIANKLNLNIHGSLLPKYRGAAPIQHSLLNGDKVTGICLMEMIKVMDGGDIFAKKEIEISENDTASTLFEKLSFIASENIVQWLKDLDSGLLKREIQDESQVTLSPKLEKEQALIENSLTCEQAINKIRAFEMNPGAYVIANGKRLKVYLATKKEFKNAPKIELSDGIIYAIDYQFESKKRVKLIK
ncbi:methionyl-tRNA formyltransferase [Mycoplasma sp. U97]|uniref:Methionyl-tRNA formyltransferase n=1 Tax=Mycoplasma tauri TaxID=547987 RepID=A0A953NEC0_9MOLU|nr:methionyl-tRNA formyltransferase [Mycoplasma tauri]MBZ4195412.1 methionyl-tRNA formyltransferase [Mycoplasma tauri]MBZ4212648.1 methionyl-tRNA formyltransferase [Mycoplasma tauri]